MTDSMEEPPVLVSQRGRLGRLELNRPRAINALNAEMVGILLTTLEAWQADDSIATVLLTGAGERGLCAGGDIVSIYRDAREGSNQSEQFWRDEYRLNSLIAHYSKPFVAVQSGLVLGGGIGVSAHGSLRIVTESSKLGMPETGIGFVPDVGGTFLLSRAPGELGTHVALTAGSVGAADAILLGLSDYFVPADRLPHLFALLESEDVETALPQVVEQAPIGLLSDQRAWIDAAYAGDDVRTILDRLSALDGEAGRNAFASVSSKSPTALMATLKSLRTAAALGDLDAALGQELRVSLRMLREPDMAEGIRAQVIDKDRNPRWIPASLSDVDPDHIDSLFAPLEHELDLR